MKNQKKIFSGITVFITMVILFVLNACQNAAGGNTKNNTETKKEKNFTLTIKCPNELVGKKLQVYHLPDKTKNGSYTGGSAKISDSGIAVYSQNLHSANWGLSLIYLQKENTVSSGDLFCFYTAQGFSSLPDGTKSLKIEEGSKTVLHADLTKPEKVKTIEEKELFQISGKVKLPNNLPDGRKAEEIFSEGDYYTVFINIADEKDVNKKITTLSLDLSITESPVVKDENLEIKYSFKLPIKFNDMQLIHHLQAFFRTPKMEGKKQYKCSPIYFSVTKDTSGPVDLTAIGWWE